MAIWLPLLLAALGLITWGARAYVARTSSAAANLQQKAGAAISQNEAQNEENARITAAADAGDAAGGLRTGQVDPNDRDGG